MQALRKCCRVNEEPSPCPDYQQVLCEDDIDEKASTAYEKNLRQVTSFLKFPMTNCIFSEPVLGVECDAFQLFEIIIQSQETATTIEQLFCDYIALKLYCVFPEFLYTSLDHVYLMDSAHFI